MNSTFFHSSLFAAFATFTLLTWLYLHHNDDDSYVLTKGPRLESGGSLAQEFYEKLGSCNVTIDALNNVILEVFASAIVEEGDIIGGGAGVDIIRDGGGMERTCEKVVNVLVGVVERAGRHLGRDRTEILLQKLISSICRGIGKVRREICEQLAKTHRSYAYDIITEMTLTSSHLCSLLSTSSRTPSSPFHLSSTRSAARTPRFQEKKREFVYFLHFTDLHLDLEYVAGSESLCPDPLCCRAPFDVGTKAPAGKFNGGKKCDSSMALTQDFLNTISNASFLAQRISSFDPDFDGALDFALFSGDIAPHDVWAENQDSVSRVVDVAMGLFHEYFDSKFPLYLSFGNHEGAPVNSFPPQSINVSSMTWLYEQVSKHSSGWIPGNSRSLPTLRTGGFYTVRRKAGSEKFAGSPLKIISINSNFCYRLNLWLYVHYMDEADPDGMLQWLEAEIAESRIMGEKVYILGHVPAGIADCLGRWSRQFHDIVKRENDVISGMFFGHTHYDQFQVMADDGQVAWISPSVTPFETGVPAFRIFQADAKTWEIIDAFTFHAADDDDDDDDGSKGGVSWSLKYSMKEYFGLSGVDAASMSFAVARMQTNDDLFLSFYTRIMMRGSDSKVDEILENCSRKSHHSGSDRKTLIRNCREFILPQFLPFQQ